jgi:hypothetical protein
MSGYAEHNFPLFNRVARLLRGQGYEVFNPAENKDGDTRQPRSFYMRLDIPALLESEAVVVLPGWEESRGASLEVWLALDLGMPIYQWEKLDGTAALTPIETLKVGGLPFSAAPVGPLPSELE